MKHQRYRVLLALAGALTLAAQMPPARDLPEGPVDAVIAPAVPQRASAAPAKARRVLVYPPSTSPYPKGGATWGSRAFQLMGAQSGAYEAEASSDPAALAPENLKRFDAVILNNLMGRPFGAAPAADTYRRAILEYARGGGGVVVVHSSATHFEKLGTAYDAEFDREYGQMIGGYLNWHPWNGMPVSIQVEDPEHPVARAFGSRSWPIPFEEEIYQFESSFRRDAVRVLLSLDMRSVQDLGNEPMHDYPLAWVKRYGAGRVFHTTFGHNADAFLNGVMLRFYLDGIQYVLGDLEADSRPKPRVHLGPDPRQVSLMEAAMPRAPLMRPAKPRRMLVLGRNDTHPPVPFAARMIEVMSDQTGAFQAVFQDGSTLTPEMFGRFDAVLINNLHGYNPFAGPREAELRAGLLEFVRGGGGLIGIHAATLAFMDWPAYGEMIGAYYQDWPWKGRQTVTIRLEDPKHPINAVFQAERIEIADEIYQFKAPYARQNLKVLASMDLERTTHRGSRADRDYAVSWIRTYGRGRVFYSVLGHNAETYWNPAVLRHYLAGIQYALGDLAADSTPNPKP